MAMLLSKSLSGQSRSRTSHGLGLIGACHEADQAAFFRIFTGMVSLNYRDIYYYDYYRLY